MEVAKKYQDRLEKIKKTVKNAHLYFKENADRFNEFRRFIFKSSLTPDDISLLAALSKPQLEFNILEAYISRLLGEFSKQEPDISVNADDESQADPVTIKVVEQHLRHELNDHDNSHSKYETYKDILTGGYSVLKVFTEYANPTSFKQCIHIRRAYDPTLCGFDPLARESHKGDGDYCFELFPMSKSEFEDKYPDVDIEKISYARQFAGFNWSYRDGEEQFILVCDYYEKKRRKEKIVYLSDGRTMNALEYKRLIENWNDFAVAPTVVRERKTLMEHIVRYRLMEKQVLEYEETDFAYLPLIFVDGNSIMIRNNNDSSISQVTRPYVYHAKGAQRLKNFAGIALANEIENIVQHKFIIKKEALPKEEEWLEAIKDIQKPSNVVVNAFYEEDPNMPIPEPIREITKVPAPPEISQAFQGSEALMQNILGSYDASLGINNNQLSGIAIVEAASQSNATAMPYIVGFLQGWQRAAQIYVDLMPKYYTTPRTLPVQDEEGKHGYVLINQPNGVNMFYDANALNVVVKAGASFQVQKSRTIMMVKEMMGMSPVFAQFIAEKGLNFVLDNMEGKGIEQLKAMVDDFVTQLEQQKQMAMQQQQMEAMNNPVMIKNQLAQQKLLQDNQKMQNQFQVDMAKLQQDENKLLADLQMSRDNNAIQAIKANAEIFSKKVDLAIKDKDIRHRHAKETLELHHNIQNRNSEKNKHH